MVFAKALCANDLLLRMIFKIGTRFEFLRHLFKNQQPYQYASSPNRFLARLEYFSQFRFLQIARRSSNLGMYQETILQFDDCPENY